MDPESKKVLEETRDLALENNKMLHAMRRSMRWGRVARIIYWIFIIGSAVGAFYVLQPYIEPFIKAYQSTSDVLKNFTPR
jgi:hypothetical protein